MQSFFSLLFNKKTMANLFFDVLPAEIRQVIYGIRLSNALTRNYYKRIAQKVALANFVIKLLQHPGWGFNIRPYYDPANPIVRYISERCSVILTKNDDGFGFWIPQLIRPIEHGLINEHGNIGNPVNENYTRTEYAVDRLIEIFGCHRNPDRRSSLS